MYGWWAGALDAVAVPTEVQIASARVVLLDFPSFLDAASLSWNGVLVKKSSDRQGVVTGCAQNGFRGRHGIDLLRDHIKEIVGCHAQIIDNLVGREIESLKGMASPQGEAVLISTLRKPTQVGE